MSKLRIYLDTSVINFLMADDAPEKRDITKRFFDHFVRTQRYEVAISDLVLDEINRTRNAEKRQALLRLISRYPLKRLPLEPQETVADLAGAYVARSVVPAKKYDDALHLAVCTVHEIDVLVSWNFEHLANVNKERKVLAVNHSLGYLYPMRITTPLEVMDYD